MFNILNILKGGELIKESKESVVLEPKMESFKSLSDKEIMEKFPAKIAEVIMKK